MIDAKRLDDSFADMPVAAILRGVHPDEVIDIANVILESGITVIEVPLNSPSPIKSIKKLADCLGDRGVVGCGTLVNIKDAAKVLDAGGQIAVMPHTNPQLIEHCLKLGLIPIPGWSTPSEAFMAQCAGARYLKLFPAASYGPAHIGAVTAIMPKDVRILAVGGIGASDTKQWLDVGVQGFGIGSEIYQPGMSAEAVAQNCAAVVAAINRAQS